MILSFGDKNRECHVRADMSSQAGVLSFRDSFARARKNSVDLFGELPGQSVLSVGVFTHERSFFIRFEKEFELVFKMHGARSNILLAQFDHVFKVFRNNLPADLDLIPSTLHNQMEITDAAILKLLGKKNQHLFDDTSTFVPRLLSNSICVGLKEGQPFLSLVPVENSKLVTYDALEASNKFADLHHRHFQLAKEKQQIIQTVTKKIKQAKNYLAKTGNKLDEINNQRSLEEVANILMANLHTISSNKKEVTLDDFYKDTPLTIKLNPKLSPQKNAENYYRKSKNKKIEIQKLEENISSKQIEAERLLILLNDLASIDNLKEIRAFNATHFGKATKKKEAPLPYYKFEIDGFDVLVGKHAKSNDILTQKVAKPNDLWLHARDVPGSHVVIRQKSGSQFPSPLIEKVAALAAWYSKRKTDSLCPVIVTPKKQVRKIKGAPPGQVVVEKEEVVMVVPSNHFS